MWDRFPFADPPLGPENKQGTRIAPAISKLRSHTKFEKCAALFLLALVSSSASALAQGGVPLWTNRYNSNSNFFAAPVRILADSAGRVVVTGSTGNSSYPYHFETVVYSGEGTAIKTNAYYADGFDPLKTALPTSMAMDGSGSVFIAGYSYADLGRPPTPLYEVVAYSAAGSRLWYHQYIGPSLNVGQNVATGVAVDGSGNVFVTGYSDGAGSGKDFATLAFSSSGVGLWTNRFNGPGNSNDLAQAIAVDGNGNVFVTGYSTNNSTGYDYVTLAYSGSGVPLWTNVYDGPASGNDYALATAVDTNGNVFVTGYSTNSSSGYDYATIAYANDGTPLWTNRYDGPAHGNDFAQAIALDRNGNVFVAGYSLGSGTGNDYATVAYSGAGVPLWTNRYSSSGNNEDHAVAVATDAIGNVFVTGYATFSGVAGYTTIAYSGAGVPLWTNRFNGPARINDYATALCVDPVGNVFVTGYSWMNGGGYLWYDYATIKYSSSINAYLGIQQSNGAVVLSWTNTSFGLQSAGDVGGPFTNVVGVGSPYLAPITGAQQFFRLALQ